MQPQDFLAVAERLDIPTTKVPTEAEIRTCLGRAYYAAYLFARERFSVVGHPTPKGQPSPHEWLLSKFAAAKTDAVQDLGERLKAMRLKRNDADYVLSGGPFKQGAGSVQANVAKTWIAELGKISDAELKKSLR